MQSLMDEVVLEGFDLNHMTNYRHENGFLMLPCEFKSGEIFPYSFEQMRHDYPCETAKWIKDEVVGLSKKELSSEMGAQVASLKEDINEKDEQGACHWKGF